MISKPVLFKKIRELCGSGWHDLQKGGGSGAPGTYLENVLGIKTTNHDGPDAGLWELKWSSKNSSSLVTLFHRSPRPRGCIKFIINKHGWIGRNGKQSFRHTIRGESDRGFKIAYDSGSIWVRHENSDSPVPHWREDDLLNSVGSKLRRLVLVTGKTRTHNGVKQVTYNRATAFEQLKMSALMKQIEKGLVAVDFDAYIKDSGSVRDHGTKFRIAVSDIQKIYEKSEKII